MVFTSPRYKGQLFDQLTFDNNIILRTNVVRYLGFLIDSKLSWHFHILHVRDKVNKGLGMLRRCCKLLPSDCLLSIYYAFVYSYLSYGIQFWGSSTENNLDLLRVSQKACIRKIVNANHLAHTAPIAKYCKILLLDDLYNFAVACNMFNVFYKRICNPIIEMFIKSNSVHDINTRHSDFNFHVPHISVMCRRWFLTVQGPIIWNNLPVNTRLCSSFNKFKTCLKDAIFSNYV